MPNHLEFAKKESDGREVTSVVLMLTTIKEAKSNSAVGNKHTVREREREIKASVAGCAESLKMLHQQPMKTQSNQLPLGV